MDMKYLGKEHPETFKFCAIARFEFSQIFIALVTEFDTADGQIMPCQTCR